MATPIVNQLPLAPLGAGDLIDRAVRLYRRHLGTLMRIAAPPVTLTAIGWVPAMIGYRNLFTAGDTDALIFYVLLFLAGLAVVIAGHIFTLLVMGGAARNLVTHLLWNEPVSVRATYSAVRSRFWKLFLATLIVLLWGGLSFFAASSVALIVWYGVLLVLAVGMLLSIQTGAFWGPAILFIIGFLLAAAAGFWIFFFMVGRVAYVPQVVLVEGKGVFESVGRSFSLAKGNVRRLMAMTLFIIFATNSALMILLAPLLWYASLNGLSLSPLSVASWPTWYAIIYSVLQPVSTLLLTPIWMLGLSLLYVDERVRHEGYDLELMASQRLGEMPDLTVASPFGTAISVDRRKMPPPPLAASGKILGLG